MNAPVSTAIARRELDVSMLVPSSIDGFYAFAKDYYAAGLVPSGYKNPDQVAIAMIKGHEFGMLPAQSIDAFYVVNGRACPWGRALRGLVQSSGNLEGELDGFIEGIDEFMYMCEEPNPFESGTIDHLLAAALTRELRRRATRIKSKNPTALYLCGYSVVKRKGQAPKVWLFDSFEAKKAGLLEKSGPWSTMPGRMCQHRASTFVRSDVFSDRLTGLDLTAEEAMDLALDLGTQPAPAAAPPRESSGPTATLAHLATQQARVIDTSVSQAPVEVVQPAGAAPPAATGKDRDAIYATTGQSPATDIPLVGEEAPNSEAAPDEAPKAAPKGKTGAAALAAAVKAAKDAGLDAAAIGSAATAAMFGEGVATKDLGDGDKAKLAQAIMGKIEAETAQQGTETEDDAEF